jgi:hypothetical protein
VALSAFLLWVTVLGVASVHLSGGALVLVLGAGVLLTYFGARVLNASTTRILMIALWTLASLDSLMVVSLFGAQRDITENGGGLASPGVGLYAAIAGLTATVIGTTLLQSTRRRIPPLAPRQQTVDPGQFPGVTDD